MMKKINKIGKLEKVVKPILQNEPATRGDDDLLYLRVLDEYHYNIQNVPAEEFILNYRKTGLPTIESVGRCRRKLQARDKTLKPTPDIELHRKEMENSFYFYSLGC